MLTRIQRCRCRPLEPLRRQYTTTPYDGTYKKLRAYPFVMNPETAKRALAKWSWMFSGRADKMLTSVLADFLPFDYHRPTRFSAVYFPAWIINAEVEAAEMTYENSRQKGNAIFRNTYVPGSDVPFLSAARLWPRELDTVEPEPFAEPLLTQHGEEVQCIPFTTSPFSILDIAASSKDSSWSITRDLQVSPSSLKTSLFSAYPVLLPLYLAQYKVESTETSQDSVTFLIQAHSDSGAIMTERLQDLDEGPGIAFKALNEFGLTTEFDLDSEVLNLSFLTQSRVRLDGVWLRPSSDTAHMIADWLDNRMGLHRNIEKLASIGQLESDDDPRIREMTSEEQNSLDQYFNVTTELTTLRRIYDAMANAQEHNTVVLTTSEGRSSKLERDDEATASLKPRLNELQQRREDLTPLWWREWEAASSSKPEPSSQQ
ncbi:hypothetical protein GALMADRAFT_156320 [Galerina marginata CBS 339.88]|uniref:Uncharacterized protein n=1 Tax=Galerina marginata (strain CBS 339.88) TaxID=685588 RepID=A0A067SZ34_GALM3|nr:hypothetical protein GALMADRAFT_156320 [Galerina marginata CBS 339.88]